MTRAHNPHPLHVLLIEDSIRDARAVRHVLAKEGDAFRITHVSRAEEGFEKVTEDPSSFDVAVVDFSLPGENGLEHFERLRRADVDVAFVLLTGAGNERLAVQALKAGVDDYVSKDVDGNYLEILPLVINGVVEGRRERLARQQAEQELKKSEERYALATGVGLVGVWDWDLVHDEIYLDPALKRMLGFEDQEIRGIRDWRKQDYPGDGERVRAAAEAYIEEQTPSYEIQHRMHHKDGSTRWFFSSGTVQREKSGSAYRIVGTDTDITERKLAEAHRETLLEDIRNSHEDMLSILNQLGQGVAMTDETGTLTFVNHECERITGRSKSDFVGKHWHEIGPFDARQKSQLKTLMELASTERRRVTLQMNGDSQQFAVEIDVQDDPGNPAKKIFFMNDVSDLQNLRAQLTERAKFHQMIGKSDAIQNTYRLIEDVARVDTTVLIEGETGTGKELVARAIHEKSARRNAPFLAVNSAGLTDSLLTSQLFGHRRGAFTGAVADHRGVFEAAAGGTLFLDEIGDVPVNVQTSLLRVLQEKEITRIGDSHPRKIDVRVLAATHRDLSSEVENGNFRADLLYRIRIARIKLPPLRERREDIPLLVNSFLEQSRAATGKRVEDTDPEALRKLIAYWWPGNVRELKSAIEFAVIHCRGSSILIEDLPPEVIDCGSTPYEELPAFTVEDEKQRFLDAIEQSRGNRSRAARLLGMSRATFYRRLAAFEIAVGK